MNSSSENSSNVTSEAADCRVWREEYHQENYICTLAAIILNILACPLTVFINALVIVAVKRKRRLQTIYNILLACLAATDLVVGIVVQPDFIVGEVTLIRGSSLSDYCKLYNQVIFLFLAPSLASLLLVALLSGERYVAIKYPFRYPEIVTTPRLTVIVILCWIAAVIPSVFVITATMSYFALSLAGVIVCVSLLVIVYCHIFVYLVTRRHMIQIQAEQVSQDAKKKFLEEKKAAKTTSIIIGCVFFSFVPMLVYRFGTFPPENYFASLFVSSKPLLQSCYLINSLCNPIVYCWRSSALREAFIQLLRIPRQNNAG